MNKKLITVMVVALMIVTVSMPTALAYSGQYSTFHITDNLFGSVKYFGGFVDFGGFVNKVILSLGDKTNAQQEQATENKQNTEENTVQPEQPAADSKAPIQPVNRDGSDVSGQAEQTSANQNQSVNAGNNVETVPGLSAQENEMVQYINEERVKAGLKPLQVDLELSRGARMKSQDMVDNGYFAHQSPTYGSPFEMMKSLGISYKAAGENIARNSSVLKAHVSLMNSEGHRQNIMNPNYTHVGIGIVDSKNAGGITVTQWFIAK